ncbi:hypothetical protein Pst134EB_025342 [Puccinia striiformis f. sp. tritici]|nr:hypothetical protein Pst134EB_025342 [Puccinia striiformis f. sp. tritici]
MCCQCRESRPIPQPDENCPSEAVSRFIRFEISMNSLTPTAHLDTPHPTTPPLTFLAFTIGIIHLHNRRYLNQDRWLACAVTSLPSIICFWFSPTFIVLS